ncbi:MAG: hypothetical protein J0I40_05475 [Cellulomonas sp.]|uniref:hypothetical protein n=1 Tax=Cellulomonas sp. 73-92 TaxID=1895740 RepID=UPI0009259084|nr:hypothetical protein [Cellulomonas sp. 73-92]MBN9374834.1 hypothetical protein [Cellulomonas sp.]OJV80951.1 MAG: hypothetical protein BGO37_15665 [Cellulomonas sp. 73-92]
MTAQSGDVAGDRATPWALDHPGAAALVSALVAIAGIGLVAGWLLAQYPGGQPPDMLGSLWDTMPLIAGLPMLLLGLPAALGFAGASCVTGRELWGGVTGGFVSAVLSLALVVVVLPVNGFAL